MGNRAVIKGAGSPIGIYLHWNGGRDSVEAFLKYCELRRFGGFGERSEYAVARLTQVIANFFGGSMSIGIVGSGETEDSARGLDNGIYIVEGWNIVRRVFSGVEQRKHDLNGMLLGIDATQPEKEQLGEEFLKADVVPVSSLRIGDEVFFYDSVREKYKKCKVVGFGNDRVVNGVNRKGVPFVDRDDYYDGDYASNPNNYLMEETIRRVHQEEEIPLF